MPAAQQPKRSSIRRRTVKTRQIPIRRSRRRPTDDLLDGPGKADRAGSLRTTLLDLAGNLWWSWNPAALELFESLDPRLWAALNHNPVALIHRLPARRLTELATDTPLVCRVADLWAELTAYLRARTWYQRRYGSKVAGLTAYFCMEYAVHESLPLYAGGLGVLAGDHLKSASDLGLPLVAVGLYWHQGYTRQGLDAQGAQTDTFPRLPLEDTPLREVFNRGKRPLRIKINLGRRLLWSRAWRLDVGRVPLYLLDTDLPENTPADRRLTSVLYSGDRDTRVRQEALLGIGGWRMLRALGLKVTACHLNEGHAAFLSLERLTERQKVHGETFAQALVQVRNTSVFTTHTPVAAGNEEFDPALVDRYLGHYQPALGLSTEQFHDLARVHAGNAAENFGMTPLALRTARYANGVAALHGAVARKMWQGLYPRKRVDQVPIGHVTNGVHIRTWLHPDMAAVYREVLGQDWEEHQDERRLWQRMLRVPDEEIWYLHEAFKRELIEFCRTRLAQQAGGRSTAADFAQVLDPRALTIGFARRFASYKRATLVFSDPARFARILNNSRRPVQIIFAGKAHPADAEGKSLIRELIGRTREPRFRRRVVFLENYDMAVARHMVAGVDVWLNNPQRPREASGTSGMKPALHGGLNVSILDGWWPEGYNRRNGFAIGRGEDHDGTKAADKRDARELYRVLEKEVVPLFFQRRADGLPRGWIAGMKNALATIPPFFNSHRQVKEYLTRYYLPAMRAAR